MSYSRWSSSPWYSFWRADSGPTKEEQVLCLWYSLDMCMDWTYEELIEMDVADLTLAYTGVPHNEILEAKTLINQFISDVDNEFKPVYN
jgi:hypothetical protein